MKTCSGQPRTGGVIKVDNNSLLHVDVQPGLLKKFEYGEYCLELVHKNVIYSLNNYILNSI